MLKSFLLLSAAALLFALAPVPSLGGAPQATTPAPTPAPAPAQASAPVAVNPVKPTPESQAKAKKLYELDCAMCHGDNGNGQTDVAKSMNLTMPDWTVPSTLAGKQDGELFGIIRNGKDKMPPEAEGRAKNDEVWNLVIYIRGFSKAQTPAATHP